MSRFLQIHLLTFYPPANLNRDDLGRPKTAVIGGTTRLRVSSQALKRAWRKSDVFKMALDGYLGDRTRRVGRDIAEYAAINFDFKASEVANIGRLAAVIFGKPEENPKSGEEYFARQLAFISPEEIRKLKAFISKIYENKDLRTGLELAGVDLTVGDEEDPDNGDHDESEEKKKPGKKPKKQSKSTKKFINDARMEILTLKDSAADIAMFGRMLAATPDFNREAAVQVAHAVTTHAVPIEDDFYTAVDDLKRPSEDAGAGFIGEAGFGSGVFYLYLCIDRDLLLKNLDGQEGLAADAIAALVEAAATVSPGGKQASFASRARAHYVLAESGNAQPRTLGAAFAQSVIGADPVAASVARLRKWRADMDLAYGDAATAVQEMEVGGHGTLADILAFCRS